MRRTHAHPTAVEIPRKVVKQDRMHDPAFNHRLPVQVNAHTAPKVTVDSTAFFGVGRDIHHARPHMWRYQSVGIQRVKSVAKWPFQVRRVVGGMHVPGTSVGAQRPLVTTRRVVSPGHASLSAQWPQTIPASYAPQYHKLI